MLMQSLVFAGQTEVWIVRSDSDSKDAFVGDKVSFNVIVDTHGEKITGVAAYITFDPNIFEPVPPVGKPFKPGSFLKTSVAVINNTHGDSLHLYNQPGWGNGIEGYQLDYYQSTGPVIAGIRPFSRGYGVVASFDLKVVNLPLVKTDSTLIQFDFNNGDNRLSCYYMLEEPGNEIRFGRAHNYKISVSGFRIDPPIPDTLIVPGSTLEVNLNDHILASSTNNNVDWTVQVIDGLPNSTAVIENNKIVVRTGVTDHGIMKLRVTGRQTSINYSDSQDFLVGVDKIPVLVNPHPPIVFFEDEQLTLPKTLFFTDADDPIPDVWMMTQSENIHVIDKSDSLTFYADQDWNGEENVQLYIQDAIQSVTHDTLKAVYAVTVVPVNDAPVLNPDYLDPLYVYNRIPFTLEMTYGMHVNDVDDNIHTWALINSDPEKLSAVFEENVLTMYAIDRIFQGTIPVTFIVWDPQMASDTLTVDVIIAPPPLYIKPLPQILVYPDSTVHLELNDYVEYPSSGKADLYWSFWALDMNTREPDNNVILSYNPVNQTLDVSAMSGHKGIDELYLTVTDSLSADSEKTLIKIFNVRKLSIFDLPEIIIMRTTEREAIDLDYYVIDLVDDVEDLKWEVLKADSLEWAVVDSISHIVKLKANNTFMGNTQVRLRVTNSRGDYETASLAVKVVEYYPNPIISPALPDIVLYRLSPRAQFYVNLDDYVWDFETPDSLITWTISYDRSFITFVKNPGDNILKVLALSKIGTQTAIFTARNLAGRTTSDTINIIIKKREYPRWKPVHDIEFTNSEIYNSLYLTTFCSNPSGEELIFSATCSVDELDISINPYTSQVTITPFKGFSGSADVIFLAANVDTSSISNLVHVRVQDQTSLACFYNSITPKRINYVINSASRVHNIQYQYSVDDENIELNFKMIDSTKTQKIWKAPYMFTRSGLYKLNVDLNYINGLTIKDSLFLTVQMGQLAKSIVSSDNSLQIIPIGAGNDNSILMLIENQNSPEGLRKSADSFQKIFTINYDGYTTEQFKAMYRANDKDKNYSFYMLEGNDLVPVATTTDNIGNFYAVIESGKRFVFAKSENQATEDPISRYKIACYPNPFNSTIKIQYLVRDEVRGSINIYNILGQTVYSGEMRNLESGIHHFLWHGTDANDINVPSGVYFIRIQLGMDTKLTSKVLLLR